MQQFFTQTTVSQVVTYSHFAVNCKLKLIFIIFGGLEVACWPLVPKFAGSNPAEAVGFFRAKKSSARLPSEAVGPMSQICGM